MGMLRLKLFSVAVLSVGLVSACSAPIVKFNEEDWRRGYRNMTTAALCTALSSSPDIVLNTFTPDAVKVRRRLMEEEVGRRNASCTERFVPDQTEVPEGELAEQASRPNPEAQIVVNEERESLDNERYLIEQERDQLAAQKQRLEEERKLLEAERRKAEEEEKKLEARRRQAERERQKMQEPVALGTGSGFIISSDGLMLTNKHVIESCEIVTVHLPSGLERARVISSDQSNDLALIKIDVTDRAALSLSERNASLLEAIIVAGFPFSGQLSSTVKVTTGVVSSLAGYGDDSSKLQVDAAVQSGNSGGPILDSRGNVVGIIVSQLPKKLMLEKQGVIPENTNFGIKSSAARAFLEVNGVALVKPSSLPISRENVADLITDTTHLIGCWVSRGRALSMERDRESDIRVSPSMQVQIEALEWN